MLVHFRVLTFLALITDFPGFNGNLYTDLFREFVLQLHTFYCVYLLSARPMQFCLKRAREHEYTCVCEGTHTDTVWLLQFYLIFSDPNSRVYTSIHSDVSHFLAGFLSNYAYLGVRNKWSHSLCQEHTAHEHTRVCVKITTLSCICFLKTTLNDDLPIVRINTSFLAWTATGIWTHKDNGTTG